MQRVRIVACLLVLAAVAVGSVVATAQESALDKIVRAGVFKVGYVVLTPQIMKDPNTGELTGYMIYCIKWIAEEMGVEVKFVEATWATVIAGLQAKHYDLSIAGTFATIPRATAVSFVAPIVYQGLGAVSLVGSGIDSLEDVDQAGVVCAFGAGTADWQWANANLKKARIDTYTASMEVIFETLLTGKADVVFSDFSVIWPFIEVHPGEVQSVTEEPFVWMPVAWALRHGDPDLLAFMNLAMNQLVNRGLLEGFIKSYPVLKGMAIPVYGQEILGPIE